MTSRQLSLSLGVLLGLGLIPGCLRPTGDPSLLRSLDQPPPPPQTTQSPYHPTPPTVVVADQKPAELFLLPVGHAEPVSLPTPTKPAEDSAPLVPPPAPEANNSPPAPEPDDPLVAALRCYLDRRPADARDHLRNFDPPTQEILSILLPLAARCTDRGLNRVGPGELSAALEQVGKLTEELRPRAALSIGKICFCHSIDRYGVYEPIGPEPTFRAGVGGAPGDLVQVYVEVSNFTNRLVGPFYETVLLTRMEICPRDRSKPVWTQSVAKRTPPTDNRSRSPRQDCFLNCHFHISPLLPVGDYTLTVTVQDMTGLNVQQVPAHRIASRRLEFRVTGAGLWTPVTARKVVGEIRTVPGCSVAALAL